MTKETKKERKKRLATRRELRKPVDKVLLKEIKTMCRQYGGARNLSNKSKVDYFTLVQISANGIATETNINKLKAALAESIL